MAEARLYRSLKMGVFRERQPEFADYQIPIFPVRDKRPPVKGWRKGSRNELLRRSRAWAKNDAFRDDDAFGFLCGEVSGLTILDIDTDDETVLRNALDACGASPLIVRTHSGKFHVYYRHGGETRSIRVPGFGGPVDVLGSGGLAVGPFSIGSKGKYEVIQGNLGDLPALPRMRPIAEMAAARKAKEHVAEAIKTVGPPGNRNGNLLQALLGLAHLCTEIDDLLRFGRSINNGLPVPLPDAEVMQVATNAWRIQSEGRNRVGVGCYMMVTHEHIDACAAGGKVGQDANWLLTIARRQSGARPAFYLANGMAHRMNWSLRRFQAARNFLEAIGEVVVVRRDHISLGPTVYRFASTPHADAQAAVPLLDAERARREG